MKKRIYSALLVTSIVLASGMQVNSNNNDSYNLQSLNPEHISSTHSIQNDSMDMTIISNNQVTNSFPGTVILLVAGVAGFFFVRKHQDLAKKHQDFMNKH